MKNMKTKSVVLSVATALVLGISGCGGGDDSSSDSSVAQSIAVDGKAVDGYLAYATVCLDLNDDGYCQAGSEPFTITDKTGGFSLSVTPAQQQANAKLLVYGGQDIDTKQDFFGKLKAPFVAGAGSVSINITPLTTFVAEMVSENLSIEEAKKKVADVLGVEPDDLDKDPVAVVNQNPKLVKAALKVQKTIEVLAKAADENATEDTVATIYSQVATALAESVDANVSFDDVVTEAVANEQNIDQNDLAGALAVATTIDDIDDNETSMVAISTIVENVKEEVVEKVIDGNESVDTLSLDTIANSDVAVLYAQGLLEFLGYSASEIESLKADVANALRSVIESATPTPEKEIAALEGYTNADLSGIATRYEDKIKELDEQVQAATSDIPFPSEFYMLNEEDGNLTIGKMSFTNGKITESAEILTSTGGWEPYTYEHKNYTLINDQWVDENDEAYTLADDNTVLQLASGMNVKVVAAVDLAKPPAEYTNYIQEMASEFGLESNISFSEGAKAYVLGFNGPAYSLYEPERDWSNMDSVTYYSTLEEFMNSRAGTNGWFKGDYNGGYAFAQPVTSVDVNDTGTLVHVQRDENGSIVIDNENAGTWKAVELAGNVAVIVDIANSDSPWKNLFTLFDDGNGKVVWRGDYLTITDQFRIDDEVVFNAQAIDDIKSAIAQQFASGDSSTSSMFPAEVTGSFVADLSAPQTGTFYHVYPDEDNGTQFWILEQLDINSSSVTWTELNTTNSSWTLESGTDSITEQNGNVVIIQSSDNNETFQVTFDKEYQNGILIHLEENNGVFDDFLFFDRTNAESFYNSLQQ